MDFSLIEGPSFTVTNETVDLLMNINSASTLATNKLYKTTNECNGIINSESTLLYILWYKTSTDFHNHAQTSL